MAEVPADVKAVVAKGTSKAVILQHLLFGFAAKQWFKMLAEEYVKIVQRFPPNMYLYIDTLIPSSDTVRALVTKMAFDDRDIVKKYIQKWLEIVGSATDDGLMDRNTGIHY